MKHVFLKQRKVRLLKVSYMLRCIIDKETNVHVVKGYDLMYRYFHANDKSFRRKVIKERLGIVLIEN